MDFWRVYRVLTRRKWILVTAVVLAAALAGSGIMMFGRKFDAQTWFGPTDTAVRRAINAGNQGMDVNYVNNDARYTEANRIITQMQAPNNVANAIYNLAYTPVVRDALQEAHGGPLYDPSGAPKYEAIQDTVKQAMQELEEKAKNQAAQGVDAASIMTMKKLEDTTGILRSAWPDFIFLDARLSYYNINRQFLRADQLPGTVTDLQKHVEMQVLGPQDIVLSVRDSDQRLAEVLADTVTAYYKSVYDKQNNEFAQKTLDFYRVQQTDAAKRLERARRALLDFRNSNKNSFTPDQVTLALRRNESARNEIESLNGTLKDLGAQIAASKARLAAMPRKISRKTQVDDPELDALRSRMASLRTELEEKRGIYTDRNPEVQRLQAQLDSLAARVKVAEGHKVTNETVTDNDEWVQLDNEIANLEQRRKGLVARVADANAVMSQTAAQVAALPQVSIDTARYNGAFAASADRLNTVNRRYSSAQDELARTDAAGALKVNYWAGPPPGTADHPESAASEGATRKNWFLFIGAVLMSLLGTAAIIVGLDFLDTSLKTPLDVERMIGDPVSGIVPRLESGNRAMLPQVTHKLPASPYAESYRFLGTDILLSAHGDNPFKTIMVATAKPGQGGTSTICNLAITLAQAGQTVALVDADMRRPSLHRIFNLSNEQGLTTVLSNGKLPSDVLQRTEIENLYVMPGGPQTDNAWKLLRSAKMRDVILDLSRDFDFVLFDTPSAVVFADAATLATMVDGVLLVVRAHESPTGSEMQVKNLLNKTKARIVGVVMNDVPVQQVDSARYYSHYYAPGTRPEPVAGPATPALPKRSTDDEI